MMNIEEEKRLESEFHLVGVKSLYGSEVDYTRSESGVTKVTVRLLPGEDITLFRSTNVVFEIPSGYPASDSGSISVIPDNIDIFRNSSVVKYCQDSSSNIIKQVMGSEELLFPWLQDTKYPLSVWFFTVRNLLKKCDYKQQQVSQRSTAQDWATPILLRENFPHKRRYHRNKSSNTSSKVRIRVGTGQTRGKRPYMEDTSFSFGSTRMNDAYQSVCVLGVLDGHGGQECALFASEELPGIITSIARREGGTNSLSNRSSKASSSLSNTKTGAALPEILFKAFRQADDEWMRTTSHVSGSTACIMLYDNGSGRAYIGNTGDTRAVMSRSGNAIDLTIDKKATDPDEIARIAICGGHVSRGRVMGSLAVSRAFGDVQLKKSRGLRKGPWSSGLQAVIVDPEITSFRPKRQGNLSTDDEFMIIATDGLWDVMSSQQAVDAVKQAIAMEALTSYDDVTENMLNKISNQMANKAVSMGSQDNVTVMIIMLSGIDDGYNTDDDDGGYISEDNDITTNDTRSTFGESHVNGGEKSNNYSKGAYKSMGAKEAMDHDLNSLLENIPSQFTAKSSSSTSVNINSSYYSTTAAIANEGSRAYGNNNNNYKSAGTKSVVDDDLDMDFLLDDSNF
jgi:protein phosphatase PTC2/3